MISVAALEEGILTLLCYSTDRAPMLALRLTPFVFTTRTNQRIAETALNYITQYRTAPGNALEYLLEADMSRGDEGRLIAQTLDTLKEQSQNIQAEFILKELDRFLDIQRMSQGIQKAMESLIRGEVDEAREAVYQATTGQPLLGASTGIWFSDVPRLRSALERGRTEFFSCGIPALDAININLERKMLSFMIAPSGFGKSWWLCEVAKCGLQFKKRTLYITNELSEDIVARRLLQAVFSLTKTNAEKIRAPYFERGEGGTVKIDFNEFERDSIANRQEQVFSRIQSATSLPPLLIKEFPTGSLTSEQLSIYLDSLARESGFIPDLLILDYADLMKIDSQALRVDTGRLYRDLRGIAVTHNLALATATQGNRESATAKVVDTRMVAEDWSKIGTADLVLTYSRTDEEKRLGLARILLAKSRDTADRIMVLISQAYAIGQFCLDSVFMNSNVAQAVDELTDISAPPARSIRLE